MKQDAKILTKYRCGNCGETHDSRYAAKECCPVTIEGISVCSVCSEEFDYYKDAVKHMAIPHVNNEPEPEDLYIDLLRFPVRVDLAVIQLKDREVDVEPYHHALIFGNAPWYGQYYNPRQIVVGGEIIVI